MNREEFLLKPQEDIVSAVDASRSISIGIPNGDCFPEEEKRVALTPEAVKTLVERGIDIVVESGAGLGANYTDIDYSESGAIIAERNSVFSCDYIMKVAPFTDEEISLMRKNQVVFSYLNILQRNRESLLKMIERKVTAVAFEMIRDDDATLPIVESMSEISGIYSVLTAAEYMSNYLGGKGIMLGGITGVPPTEVVILGANTAGEFAAKTAIGLGSQVKVFDKSLSALRHFANAVGGCVQTSVFHQQILRKSLLSADVVIGAMNLDDLRPHYYVTEEMVKTMKRGAVIIDLSIDRGGCIETAECRSLAEPAYQRYGVIHFSAWNLQSRVARTASMALSNIITPMLLDIVEVKNIKDYLRGNQNFAQSVYMHNGTLTNETLATKFYLPSKELKV